MDEIIAYLQKKYDPAAVLVYGSFADGTQSENSDFDALVLSQTHREFHDTSFVGETQLDVFVYPLSLFQGEYHPETFVQVYGGIPVKHRKSRKGSSGGAENCSSGQNGRIRKGLTDGIGC